jgi:hypothetical protein
MLVNGNQLKQAIKMKSMELNSVFSTFEDTLYKFEDESKSTPYEISTKIINLEYDISKLQSAQKYYNSNITFNFNNNDLTLQTAINYVGGLARMSKKWRTAAQSNKKRTYYGMSDTTKRNKDEEHAKATITKDEALHMFKKIEKQAALLRNLIAEHNTKMVEINFINESLFD